MTDLVRGAAGRQPGGARAGGLRAWLGRSLHVAYQEDAARADPSFEAEVPLHESFSHGDVRVSLHGRADAVRREPRGWLVQELKSLAAPDPTTLAAWRLQAALYARMLARERGAPARAELVFVGSGAARPEPVTLAGEALALRLAEALEAWLAELRRRADRRASWWRAAEAVRFPFPAQRPGQPEIGRAVEAALRNREQLLIEASTGSGKTAAILTPALRHAMQTGRPLVVLTAATLQQHLAIETLGRLATTATPLVARLRAKRRMCTRGDLLCHESVCERLSGYAERRAAGGWVERCFDARGLALPDALYSLGVETGICPYELQLDAAGEALITVCDLNYAIDPGVMLPALRDRARLAETVLVVDEIHQLPERTRRALSVRIDAAEVSEAVAASALGGGRLHREVRDVCEELVARVEEASHEAGALADGCWLVHEPSFEALERIALALRRLALDALETLAGAPAGPAFASVFEVAGGLDRFLAVEPRAPGFVSLAGRAGGAAQLERFCRDPAPALGRLFGGCHALIGCSATLSPPEWFQAELGLDPDRAVHERVRAPDASARRAVVIDASVRTTERSRPREVPRIARRLAALCAAVPGNVLALFPSHAFLDAVKRALPPLPRRVRAQARDDDEPERSAHLAALREADDGLLLAVAGGALAEGVDYAGARLAAVAVVGPCLPAVDAHRALLEEHYAEHFERGFELAYAVPGMIRVVQSVGRLLRGEADRGVVALFGRRFLREPYVSLLPEEWLGGRPAEELAGDAAAVARAFFAHG